MVWQDLTTITLAFDWLSFYEDFFSIGYLNSETFAKSYENGGGTMLSRIGL